LAKILDSLPNGFPETESGIEIRILKKVYAADEAELFCDLKLHPETAEQIAERTGRPLEGLEDKLTSMAERGEVMGIDFQGTKVFAMIPWVVGIYEFQINRLDREFCEMCEEYFKVIGPGLMRLEPRIMQTVPIEEEIPARNQALPYHQVSQLVENGKSFRVNQCICKKEQGLMEHPCEKPNEVCLAISPVEGADFILDWGREITKEQALTMLREAEDAGLVHLTGNVASGHTFICNCCGCCCGVLRQINDFGMETVVNSHYCAEIDPDECNACGVCADERCQVHAIEEGDDAFQVLRGRCIGCGLCVTTCPTEAIRLVHRPQEEISHTPESTDAWNEQRAAARGVDYSAYK